MIKLSRSAWIAIAAVTAVPATIAVAATAEKAGWHQMSPETRARLDEGKLAMVKAALKLTPDQEKLWTPIEAQVRAAFKDRDAKRAEHEKMRAERQAEGKADGKDGKRPDMAERFTKMSQKMSERAERMKTFSGSFQPFYAALTDEQKDVLRPLAHDLMPGQGGRGHGGKRWAFGGGWGGHEGRGEHGGWGGGRHHGEHGDRGERGGQMMDDGGSGNAPGQGDAPAKDGAKPADKQ
jgi:hypothetical protein